MRQLSLFPEFMSAIANFRVRGDDTLRRILIEHINTEEVNYLDEARLDVSKFLTDEKLSSPILILIHGGKS